MPRATHYSTIGVAPVVAKGYAYPPAAHGFLNVNSCDKEFLRHVKQCDLPGDQLTISNERMGQ